MVYNPTEYRYKYEREKLKRIALDVNREAEYKPLKEYCDTHEIAVSRLIRDLCKQAINEELIYIPEPQLEELKKITADRNTTAQDLISKAITNYIAKYKEGK